MAPCNCAACLAQEREQQEARKRFEAMNGRMEETMTKAKVVVYEVVDGYRLWIDDVYRGCFPSKEDADFFTRAVFQKADARNLGG